MAKKKFYSESKSFANLPQEVTMRPYPESPFGSAYEGLNDTIEELDNQMREDGKGKSYKKGKFTERF